MSQNTFQYTPPHMAKPGHQWELTDANGDTAGRCLISPLINAHPDTPYPNLWITETGSTITLHPDGTGYVTDTHQRIIDARDRVTVIVGLVGPERRVHIFKDKASVYEHRQRGEITGEPQTITIIAADTRG